MKDNVVSIETGRRPSRSVSDDSFNVPGVLCSEMLVGRIFFATPITIEPTPFKRPVSIPRVVERVNETLQLEPGKDRIDGLPTHFACAFADVVALAGLNN